MTSYRANDEREVIPEKFRILLQVSAKQVQAMHLFEVEVFFLHSPIEEEVRQISMSTE